MNQSQADANRAGSAPLPPPEHLSEPAQAILRAGDDMLGDLADYRSARQRINRIADARSQSVRDEGTDFEFEAVDTNGARSYWITSARQDDTERVLVYAHGGGYVAGEAARVIEHPLRLGRAARLPVLSVEYGRAPENPWPAALEDCLRAHQWLLEQGYAPRHIAWSGLSAGGGIVVAMALAARERNIPLPGAIYGMAPWADLTLSGDSYRVNAPHDHVLGSSDMAALADMYAGSADKREPTISPVYGDLRGLPPLLVDAGTREILLSDAVLLAQRARSAGADVTLDVWDGLWHGFHNAQEVPEAHLVTRRGAAFIRSHVGCD